MSRHRVPNDKRQRTARACDNCRRRKQKCNGHQPCHVCSKKSFVCSYSPKTDSGSESPQMPPSGQFASFAANPPGHATGTVPQYLDHAQLAMSNMNMGNGLPSNIPAGTAPVFDEEAVFFTDVRMLQDPTGRLLCIGDSSTLSYLHLFRRMVESISGTSRFTGDPYKGKIIEAAAVLPADVRPPCPLADYRTAEILVVSFFTNTIGLIDVVDHQRFHEDLKACYANPLSASRQFLCLLYLMFAIGLVMNTPQPGTEEEAVIRRLREESRFDQAELFFQSAKCHKDPANGFEDADFWSVQALSLMSVYMLAVSRRNAAFTYHGMAVRSAIALGLHRKESMGLFQGRDLKVRCNVWRSLYVLDRFIAASLGRPTAINEEECTDEALRDESSFLPLSSPLPDSEVHVHAMNACIHGSRIVGTILKKVYAKRQVSSNVTQEIVSQCDAWERNLPECMNWQHWHQVASRAHGLAMLHVHLLYHHGVILLTRPFFLFLVQTDRGGPSRITPHLRARTERFSEICVAKSYQTIAMLQSAREAMHLPQRDPFLIYYLFTAALVIMSNEFIALFYNPLYTTAIQQAISMMGLFSAMDPQADRLSWILCALQEVVRKQAAEGVSAPGSSPQARFSYQMWSTSSLAEPLGRLFAAAPAAGLGFHAGDPFQQPVQPHQPVVAERMPDPAPVNAIAGEAISQPSPEADSPVDVSATASGVATPANSPESSHTEGFDMDYLWSWPVNV